MSVAHHLQLHLPVAVLRRPPPPTAPAPRTTAQNRRPLDPKRTLAHQSM
jgi:hypothetical protein